MVRGFEGSITASGEKYTYDGDGRRIMRTTAAGVTSTFVYDAAGQLAAEYGGSNTTTGTLYLTGDHLGSTRLITDSTGAAVQCRDYLPFGEQILVGSASPRIGLPCFSAEVGVNQQFTGKERDAETGLDWFDTRYFASALGRFTSPDAMIMKKEWLADPQRWNHYAYVRNNPLRYVDPNGEDLTLVYSTAGLNDENLEYFKKNQKAIFAAVQEKFKAAGVDKVNFVDRASLSKEQQSQLSEIPAQDGRAQTFVHGLAQVNFLDNRSEIVKRGNPYTNGYGFTNSGRAEIFLSNIEEGGCGRACAIANVIAHELGHALGLEDRGHAFDPFGVTQGLSLPEFGREVLMGRPRDVMYSGDPNKAPFGFNTNVDRNQRILGEVNRVGKIY